MFFHGDDYILLVLISGRDSGSSVAVATVVSGGVLAVVLIVQREGRRICGRRQGTSPVIHLHFWHVSSHLTGTRLVKSRRLARHIQKIQIDKKRQDRSTWICIIIVTVRGPGSSSIYSTGRHRPMPERTWSTLRSNQIVLMSASVCRFVFVKGNFPFIKVCFLQCRLLGDILILNYNY